ncbi:MAG: hypothetical protein K0S99_3870 [Thermomicrobiales bacterium]|nr:hypothetical protein [Thermomicrobiales bacterium]
MRRSSNARASGHRGNNADFVTGREARFDTVTVADVLAVDKDIHKSAELT